MLLYAFVAFLFSYFVLYPFQYTDLSNCLIRSFNSFWLSFADKVTTGNYNFVSLIVKIILLELASSLSLPPIAKTQCFVHSSFHSTLELINDISFDHQKLLRYLNGTAIVAFSTVPFAAAVLPINFVLSLKDFKILVFTILEPKSLLHFWNKMINYLMCQNNLNYTLTSYTSA